MQDHARDDCLTRLAELRGSGLPDLGQLESDPTPLLRRLAVELELPAADLFVLGHLPLPADLSPVDRMAGARVEVLVRVAIRLDGSARSRLQAAAASVVTIPTVIDIAPIPYGPGPGALIYALLRVRNLDQFQASSILGRLTGRYVAGSVIRRMADGYVKLTPDWLADLAAVLGMSAGVLSAMTGLEVAEVPRDPGVTDCAQLIRTVRRFTRDQIESLIETASAYE
jgi:hypothetical protein